MKNNKSQRHNLKSDWILGAIGKATKYNAIQNVMNNIPNLIIIDPSEAELELDKKGQVINYETVQSNND